MVRLVIALAILCWSSLALAEDFQHTPISTARAGETIDIDATLVDRKDVKRVVLVYRTLPGDAPQVVAMKRRSSTRYVASIPVARPTVFYNIEIERDDGERRSLFATRERPHRIQVAEDISEVRERALLERVEGRRSLLTARGEYVSFGESDATVLEEGDTPRNVAVDDGYWRAELSYHYRFFGFVSQLGMRAGVLRGSAPVGPEEASDKTGDERFESGLNYVAPTLRLRMHDAVHVDLDVVTSVTDDGFGIGGGGALIIGDPLATRLELGFEGVSGFGMRFGGRLAIAASEWLLFAPTIEVTNMPNAEVFGVRLLGDIELHPGAGFFIGAGGGYQAREATAGGASFAGRLGYAF